MSEYRKLDLNSINFSKNTVSYDDATKNALQIDDSKESIKILTAEKDYKKQCVKLVISY